MSKIKRLVLGIYAGMVLFLVDCLVTLFLRYEVYYVVPPKLIHILLGNLINFLFVVAVVYFLLPYTEKGNKVKGERRENNQDTDSNV